MPEDESSEFVNDEAFVVDVQRLRRLRTFLYKQALTIEFPPTPLSFAAVSKLRWKNSARSPSEDERATVDIQTETIFRSLSEPLRRRFLMGELPWWIAALPVVFAVIAFVALTLSIASVATTSMTELALVARTIRGQPAEPAIISRSPERPAQTNGVPNSQTNVQPLPPQPRTMPIGARILPFYLLWLMALGAMGAVAFVGMNVLSVQEDATFDMTNPRLMVLRIVTGALFGLVLTLPFGFGDYVLFCIAITGGVAGAAAGSELTKQAAMFLLPFILGFSTSLVIMLLNQFIEGVQAFFGKKTVSTSSTSEAPRSTSKQSQGP